MSVFKRQNTTSKKNFWATNTFLALMGVCLVAASIFLWKTEESRTLSQIAASTEAQARFYASETEARYTSIYEALERLASRGEPHSETNAEDWKKDAQFYIDAFVGIESITYVDKSFHIRQIVPTQLEAYVNANASQIEGRPSDVMLWLPIYEDTEFKGYILGVVALKSFISPVISEIQGDYMLRLSEEGTTVFSSEDWTQPRQDFAVNKTITLEETTVLQLLFAPTDSFLRSGIQNARGTLWFGLFFSFIAIVAAYSAQNFNAIAMLNEMRYRNLFNASQDAIFIFNLKDEFKDANPAAVRMVGFSLEEIQQMTVDDLRVADNSLDPGQRERLWKDGGAIEVLLRHQDGHHIPVDLMISPITEGQVQKHVLGIARDISERVRTERELERYRHHLEELVEERTAQLEKTNQELEDFAYVISHDLKAPLRGIIRLAGWITVDYADVLDDEGREMLRLLNKRTKRMHNLILGILQYSRIGRIKGKEEPIDLNQLTAEVIDTLAPPPHIHVIVENHLPTVIAVRVHLVQVFQNLIENAIKYMDKPDGHVSINCDVQNGSWHFCVSDNGPGIEAKYFKKIFLMFQTLAPRDEIESTGVGLALVKKIVEAWGGQIWVESAVGEGSEFYFTLPKP